jgi:hypothetical protein
VHFIRRRIVSGFDELLSRLLIKRFDLLSSRESHKSDCPDLNILAAYLSHNLTASQTTELEGHMSECRLCRKTVIHTFKSLENLPDPSMPDMKNP